MKKLSSRVKSFIFTVLAFAADGLVALLDGALQLESSDPSVLRVEQGNDGQFTVVVVGPGTATLTAWADADLSEGERVIKHSQDFLIFDAAHEADHLVSQVSGVVYQDDNANAETTDSDGDAVDVADGTVEEAASAEVEELAS